MTREEREQKIFKEMQTAMSVYSTECVHADGERPRQLANLIRLQGRNKWNRLVERLGRQPLMKELYPDSCGKNNDIAYPDGL